jgi:hypothetical protein
LQNNKYPALPYGSSPRKQGTEVPLVAFKIEMDRTSNTNYPTKDKVRYVVFYGAKNNSKLDVNIPVLFLIKLLSKKKRLSTFLYQKLFRKTIVALTFIDFYETKASQLLLTTTEMKPTKAR